MKKSHISLFLFVFLAFSLAFAPAVFADTSYVVQPGDTLYKIAVQHGVTMQEIASANGIWNYDHIEVGQVLTIPGADVCANDGQLGDKLRGSTR